METARWEGGAWPPGAEKSHQLSGSQELSFANNLSNLSRHGPHFPHKVFRQDVALTDTHLGPGKLQEMDTAKPTWLSDIQKL